MRLLGLMVAICGLLGGCAHPTRERSRELSEEAQHLFRRGAYADARDLYQAALALQPENPDLIYQLASCQDKLGLKAEALQGYQRCLQYEPNHLDARHAWLVYQLEIGNREAARKMVEDWLQARPDLAGPYLEDGWLRAQEGDLDSARGRFQQALEREPRNPRALNELARVYERLNRPDRALVLYERSLAAHPQQPEIRAQLEQLRAGGVRRPHPD